MYKITYFIVKTDVFEKSCVLVVSGLARLGLTRSGTFRPESVRFVPDRPGEVREPGPARPGPGPARARLGPARLGSVPARLSSARPGPAWLGRRGLANPVRGLIGPDRGRARPGPGRRARGPGCSRPEISKAARRPTGRLAGLEKVEIVGAGWF